MNYLFKVSPLKNVYTCRLARLISPMGSTVNDLFASYLTQIDFVARHFEPNGIFMNLL